MNRGSYFLAMDALRLRIRAEQDVRMLAAIRAGYPWSVIAAAFQCQLARVTLLARRFRIMPVWTKSAPVPGVVSLSLAARIERAAKNARSIIEDEEPCPLKP